MEVIRDQSAFNSAMNSSGGGLTVIHFMAEWATQCSQITDVFLELKKELPKSIVSFLQVSCNSKSSKI